tara:strand:- start:186 stop:539 length:354 start_codon:yes stop_codon:yes gene_type:complete
MASRYANRVVFNNVFDKYITYQIEKSKRPSSATPSLIQYATPTLFYPSTKQMQNLDYFSHVWKQGDSLYKLADKYYNDPELWWVISWFNKKPLPSDFKLGDIVEILNDYNDIYMFID